MQHANIEKKTKRMRRRKMNALYGGIQGVRTQKVPCLLTVGTETGLVQNALFGLLHDQSLEAGVVDERAPPGGISVLQKDKTFTLQVFKRKRRKRKRNGNWRRKRESLFEREP